MPFNNKRISVEDSVVYHISDILKELNKKHPKKVVKAITGPHKISNCGSREESTGEWKFTFQRSRHSAKEESSKKDNKEKKGA